MESIRVRFAPSPTGSLHIGGARTALYNWLFARQNKGKFILRIEDTDVNRSTESSVAGIIDGLQWLGLDWDEGPDKGGNYGPYRQSERLPLYQEYLQKLIAEGKAYYCFCTAEDLQKQREQCEMEKRNYKYNGTCRCLSPEVVQEKLRQGIPAVIRIKAPQEGTTIVEDLVRGPVVFNNELMEDFIIAKSDGWPTYNFAVVVDDHLMQISHVIRAEEHLSNTPKQIILYEALGFKAPQFAHISMILSPERSKLSKRHGATSVQEFREQGFLPEALLNYLFLLGLSPGKDIDLLSLEQMLDYFAINKMSKSPAVYDMEKLHWMNGQYINSYDPDKIYALLIKLTGDSEIANKIAEYSKEYTLQVIKLLRSRVKNIKEIATAGEYFFTEIKEYDAQGVKKYFNRPDSRERLEQILNIIKDLNSFAAPVIEKAFRETAENSGIKAAALIHPARLAVTGRTATPGLFEVMEILGKQVCMDRVENALGFVKSQGS